MTWRRWRQARPAVLPLAPEPGRAPEHEPRSAARLAWRLRRRRAPQLRHRRARGAGRQGDGRTRRRRGVGCFTPWSNNATLFSLPLGDGPARRARHRRPDRWCPRAELGRPRSRSRLASGSAWPCRSPCVREVGLMDPVFGRGYCEEVDWCHGRARRRGLPQPPRFRHVRLPPVAPRTAPPGCCVDVDDRPRPRADRGDALPRLPRRPRGLRRPPRVGGGAQPRPRGLGATAVRKSGYDLDVAELVSAGHTETARVILHPSTGAMEARVLGLAVPVVPGWGDPMAHLVERFGLPRTVTIRDRGAGGRRGIGVGAAAGHHRERAGSLPDEGLDAGMLRDGVPHSPNGGHCYPSCTRTPRLLDRHRHRRAPAVPRPSARAHSCRTERSPQHDVLTLLGIGDQGLTATHVNRPTGVARA